MARLLLPPGYPVFGSDGELSASAKAFFYETGTTTDKTVYQDEALTTPHTQPITADGNGIIAGPVYGDESEDYKVTFKTSADATLRTVDPLPNLDVSLGDVADGVRGDLIAMGASAWGTLAIGAADRLLVSDGTDPSWGQIAAGMVPDDLVTLAMMAHGTAGDILYYNAAPTLLNIGTAGQVLQVNSGATAPEWATLANGIQSGGALDTSTGTSVNSSDLGVTTPTRITLVFNQVSVSGTDDLLIQLGDSGGIETTGYTSRTQGLGASGVNQATSTAGFIIKADAAGESLSGIVTLINHSGNVWIASGILDSANTNTVTVAGRKELSAAITQITVKPSASDNLDSGSVQIYGEA